MTEVYSAKDEILNFNKSEARYPNQVNGWNIKTSVHAGSQAYVRRPEFKKEDWQDLHKKVIGHVENNNIPNGEHIFYSGKKRQGFVGEVNHQKKQLKVITVLDRGASRVAHSDTGKHIVENAIQIYILD